MEMQIPAILVWCAELKRNSRQKATKGLFGIEYESNLRVKA